jgi:hypothetical protein
MSLLASSAKKFKRAHLFLSIQSATSSKRPVMCFGPVWSVPVRFAMTGVFTV